MTQRHKPTRAVGGMLTYSKHKCKHECIDNDGKPSARSIRDDGRSYYLKSDDDSVLLVKANIPARGRARKFTLIEAERQHYFGAFGNLRIGALKQAKECKKKKRKEKKNRPVRFHHLIFGQMECRVPKLKDKRRLSRRLSKLRSFMRRAMKKGWPRRRTHDDAVSRTSS